MKQRIIAWILILSGLVGLCMTACGTVFAFGGLASITDKGEGGAFAGIFLFFGLLTGMLPGGIILFAVWWFRSHIRPRVPDRTKSGDDA